MNLKLSDKIENEISQMVTDNDTAASYGKKHMPVLATSKIVAFMEHVALSSVERHLPPGYATVGSEINLKHLRPVKAGTVVHCRSRLKRQEGRDLFFEIGLWAGKQEVAHAEHKRTLINETVFLRMIGEKAL